MARCPKVPNIFYRFRHCQKSKSSMICNAICEKKKKTEIHKVFQRDRDSKESMQTIIFFFLSNEYFKSVHLTSPCLHQSPCRKLAALNWLPTCEWVGWGILLGATATKLTNRWPLALARGLQRTVHLKEWGRGKWSLGGFD